MAFLGIGLAPGVYAIWLYISPSFYYSSSFIFRNASIVGPLLYLIYLLHLFESLLP